MSRGVCTIIAKNYLAFARTLAGSFLEYHPNDKVYVLVVDDFEECIATSDECFEIVKLSDLKISKLNNLCFKYDVKELCTAVKARFLEFLLHDKAVEQLIYLDPDILVTERLDQLFERLNTADIVLTPHLDLDYPNDALFPNDRLISLCGQFNLGFIGVNKSDNANQFLKWWKEKLYESCIVDLRSGYFVDQKFIDFVPSLFSNFWIEKDTGYNVAYWNLHSRRISKHDDKWRCNSGPMYFFHFSGYSPGSSTLSTHVPLSVSRHNFENRPDLRALFETYRTLLIKNGYEQTITWPYTFARFNSGRVITTSVRRYYLGLGNERNSLGDPFESPELEEIAASVEENDATEITATKQLEAILNSRAWHWVARYGRVKTRLTRALGDKH